MVKHDLKNNKYIVDSTETTKRKFDDRKSRLLSIREYSDRLYSGKITENDVPTELLNDVLKIVEIRKTPSLEEVQS